MSRFEWGLWGLLALGLAACGSDSQQPKPIEPGSGFKAERQDGVVASLSIPDQVSPVAALIQGEVTLRSTAPDVQVVTVLRPCDVLDWIMLDAGGRLVMSKDPVECVEQPTAKALAPDSTLNERIWIYLLPNVLKPGQRYVIDYRFWGQPAQAEFTARR